MSDVINIKDLPEGKQSFGILGHIKKLSKVVMGVANGTTLSKVDEVQPDSFTPNELGVKEDKESQQAVEKAEKKKEEGAKKKNEKAVKKVKVQNQIVARIKDYQSTFNTEYAKRVTHKQQEGSNSMDDNKPINKNNKGGDHDEDDNPVEVDSIKKIISFLKYLVMRKGYWKLKQFLKTCQSTIDVKFAARMTNSLCNFIVEDNSFLKIRLRLSGETWPPFLIYKIINNNSRPDIIMQMDGNRTVLNGTMNRTYIKPNQTNVNSVYLDLPLNDAVKSYQYKSYSQKEDYYKEFNLKDNYYRYVFSKEIYTPIRGNLVKRNEKLQNNDKANYKKLPFENIAKPVEINLDEFKSYKKKQIKNNVMTDLFVTLNRKNNTNRINATPTPGVTQKNILKPKENIMYYNSRFNTLKKMSDRNTHRWKNTDNPEIVEEEHTGYIDKIELRLQKELDDQEAYVKRDKIDKLQMMRNYFLENYKRMWVSMSTPKVVQNNKYVEDKIVNVYFSSLK